jgi:hypothetical protein
LLSGQVAHLKTHPAYFDTYRDETMNRRVKTWARGVHFKRTMAYTLSRALYLRQKTHASSWRDPACAWLP